MGVRLGRERQAGTARLAAILALALAGLAVAGVGFAQDRATMIRSLSEASDFRVRVQVAFGMGNTRDAVYRPHLERALRDSNPAVRAAAATSLGRLGDRRALVALRRAVRDDSAAVRMQAQRAIERLEQGDGPPTESGPAPGTPELPAANAGFLPSVTIVPEARRVSWPTIRYAVVLGAMDHRTRHPTADSLVTKMRDEVLSSLVVLRGVAVFPNEAAINEAANREIRRRRIPKMQLDGNLVRVDAQRGRSELSVRCEVSLTLVEEGNLRGMLTGAATGSEPPRRATREQTQRLAEQALSAAVRSAMSDAPSALARATRR
ncbi:MAG: HEAT repeat domain-containing protein [Sandaracinus sp.]|nr:HEAT repeat domain-containing protein [Myxococcales bacterium]MCB9615560.1 HEAT repeat domain-containing protein [Sandaracinus sp.]